MPMGIKVFIASAILFLLLFGIVEIGVANANPITWLFQPNQDEPILVIEAPQNYTAVRGNILVLNFSVTKPSSWNEGTSPAGMIDNIDVTLNDKKVFSDYPSSLNNLLENVTSTYSIKVDKFDSGMNTLKVNVYAHTTAGYVYSEGGGIPTLGANTLRMNVTDTLVVNYSNKGIDANLFLNITGSVIVAVVAIGLLICFAKRRKIGYG